MNCDEFDRLWNDLLDAETTGRRALGAGAANDPLALADRDRAAGAHAATCPRCRQVHARNQTLRKALRAWAVGAFPVPASPRLVERIVTSARPGPSRWSKAVPMAMAAAIAACLLVALAPMLWRYGRARARAGWAITNLEQPGPPRQPGLDRPLLGEALADATAATWDLALSTSQPAARLGREVFAVTSGPDDPDASVGVPGPDLAGLSSVLRGDPSSPLGAGWLQDVGDGLSSSVRPLSSTAQQAFGFLRTPAIGRKGSLIPSPSSKGA